jgi:hypothetical protein
MPRSAKDIIIASTRGIARVVIAINGVLMGIQVFLGSAIQEYVLSDATGIPDVRRGRIFEWLDHKVYYVDKLQLNILQSLHALFFISIVTLFITAITLDLLKKKPTDGAV